MQKTHLGFLTAIILTIALSGCASPTSEYSPATTPPKTASEQMILDGQALVVQGEEDIADGKTLELEGEEKLAKGRALMRRASDRKSASLILP
jgi:hypothetical protein